MKVEINTTEDSHEEIRKVIKMLQHIVGDAEEVFTNQPTASAETTQNAFVNMFGDSSSTASPSMGQETPAAPEMEAAETKSESTEDLFAELFSAEEIQKMDTKPEEEEEEVEVKPKKKHAMEFY